LSQPWAYWPSFFQVELIIWRDFLPTGLWVATAIRAVLGLGLLAAAEDSKAPALLRILGGLILIVAAATLLLGLDRHRRMIDWWLARNRSIQIAWGAAAFALGVFLIYAIL